MCSHLSLGADSRSPSLWGIQLLIEIRQEALWEYSERITIECWRLIIYSVYIEKPELNLILKITFLDVLILKAIKIISRLYE